MVSYPSDRLRDEGCATRSHLREGLGGYMCYSHWVDRIGIRELRNQVSEVIRRVRRGERILITSNGVPVAELGPVTEGRAGSLEELAEAGLLRLPRSPERKPDPKPLLVTNGLTSTEVLEDLRSR